MENNNNNYIGVGSSHDEAQIEQCPFFLRKWLCPKLPSEAPHFATDGCTTNKFSEFGNIELYFDSEAAMYTYWAAFLSPIIIGGHQTASNVVIQSW